MPGFLVYFAGLRVTPKTMTPIEELRQTIARLRGPGGCPWDQEQTHASLVRCLIDEVSELIDTIDRLDLSHMREELGDVLIQVVFHTQLAEEGGHFNFDDVAREVNEKLVRRHPHVFGETKLGTSDEVLVQWEQIKAREKKAGPAPSGVFKEQPPRLPALMLAEAIWKQIEKKQLPVPALVDAAQIRTLGAQLDDESVGKMLFEVAAACRTKGLDPEGALRRHTARVMQEVEKNVQGSPA